MYLNFHSGKLGKKNATRFGVAVQLCSMICSLGRGEEDLGGGTPGVRYEPGIRKGGNHLNAAARLLEGAMPNCCSNFFLASLWGHQNLWRDAPSL